MRRTSSDILGFPEDTLVMLSLHFLFTWKPTPACPLLAPEWWYRRWPLWRVVKLSSFRRTFQGLSRPISMLFSFSSSSSSCTCSSFSNVLTLYVAIFSRSLLMWWFFLAQRFLAPLYVVSADPTHLLHHRHPCCKVPSELFNSVISGSWADYIFIFPFGVPVRRMFSVLPGHPSITLWFYPRLQVHVQHFFLPWTQHNIQVLDKTSEERVVSFGVPQGSVLDTLLLISHTATLCGIARRRGISIHLYADDPQLYISFSPLWNEDTSAAMTRLQACVVAIQNWMIAKQLKLNADKTNAIVICSPRIRNIIHTS